MMLLLLALLQDDKVTALVGGDVYTVTQGVVRGGTVLIRGDKIEAVGDAVEIPEGSTVMDVKGFRVYPGWIAASARGIGGGMPGSGKAADSLDPFDLTMELGVACGLTSCFLEPGGVSFWGGRASASGATAVMRLTVGDVEKIVWREPASVDLTAAWLNATPSQRYDLLDKFRQAKEHLAAKKDYEARKGAGKLKKDEKEPKPPGGVEQQLQLLAREIDARMDASRWADIRTALDLVERYPFPLSLVGVEEGWIHPDEISRAGVRCVVDARARLDEDKSANRPSGSRIELAAILHKAGVKVALIPPSANISTGGIGGRDLMTLPLAAAFAIRGGLPEQAALEGITITAAEICGIEGRVGSIEAGKQADLIVVDGDPFHYLTMVQKTFVAGREVYDKSTSPYFKHIRPKEIPVSVRK